MKLLCWMHRKFRQNSHEALKALVMGQSTVDDQQYFQKTSYGGRPFKQEGRQTRKSFTAGVIAAEDVEDYYEEEESPEMSELFHGFLAIGTLGSPDHNMMATPTFAISDITEKETEATENEFKLINDELEKVLLAAVTDDDTTSSRNSHVSNGRSSHGSVITLSGKPDDVAAAVCPLQGYLFGSAIDMSATGAGRKENRTSLGELFQKTKTVSATEGDRVEEKRAEKEADNKSAVMNLVKKKLKKKMLHNSSRSSSTTIGAGGGDPSAPAPSETKLHKILHMFHRKVHPETTEVVVKSSKKNNEHRKKPSHDEEGQIAPDDEDMTTLCPQRALFLKQKIRRYRSQSNPSHHFNFGSIDCNAANREQWIKTDADYLVLEL